MEGHEAQEVDLLDRVPAAPHVDQHRGEGLAQKDLVHKHTQYLTSGRLIQYKNTPDLWQVHTIYQTHPWNLPSKYSK